MRCTTWRTAAQVSVQHSTILPGSHTCIVSAAAALCTVAITSPAAVEGIAVGNAPLPCLALLSSSHLLRACLSGCPTPGPGNGSVPCTLDPSGLTACPQWHTMAVYDWKWYSQTVAILNISRSIFIISFLSLGAWLLSRDSRVLVSARIEPLV